MSAPSLWLGPARAPIRLAMIAFASAAGLLILGLAIGSYVFSSPIGMNEMLRPEGRVLVYVTLAVVFAAVLFTALFLSDTVGSIERAPSGFFDYIALVCSRISMLSLVILVCVMFYEVVSRYIFEVGTLWANELSLWVAGFLFLLAGLYAMQQRSHIRIYIIYDMMPRWARKLSDTVSVALIWVFAFAIVWGGYGEASSKFERWELYGSAWDPPIPATIKPAILIIIVMVAIQALSNLIADWNRPEDHHSPADEIDEQDIENMRKLLDEDK